jgi:hypothetical protein
MLQLIPWSQRSRSNSFLVSWLRTPQTVSARPQKLLDDPNGAAHAGGFSMHAGIWISWRGWRR